MGFIKFLFIAVLILWVIRVILRIIFPMVLKNMFGKMQQQADSMNQNKQREYQKPEGSISIDYVPPGHKQGNSDKLGDFVEYEEVK